MAGLTVFTDFHHAGLLHSLIMLFEDRLGGKVYRPIGVEWAEKGFWKVYDHPATIQQFLGIGGATPDGSPPLNELPKDAVDRSSFDTAGFYLCQDIDSGLYNKAITFDAFMAQRIDIVIASIPQHIEPFKKLCALHPNHPKLIFQIGNAWTVEAGLAPNIMASAIIHGVPADINFISYHQEFDLSLFKPVHTMWEGQYGYRDNEGDHPIGPKTTMEEMPGQKVYSFVNCFDTAGHFASDWQLFKEVEREMPGWDFRVYGGQCRDGAKHGAAEVAKAMQDSRFVWHTKAGGDGYGHVIHNSAAVGRPLIVKAEYYRGKMAEPLLKDGVTCIHIDGLSYPEVINKIHYYSEPQRYLDMCRATYANFKETVDFDQEEILLKEFLGKLK